MPNFESPKNQNEQSAVLPPGIKTPPIKPGEVFDPRKALHELKEIPDGKQSREERLAARQEVRGKLDYQKEGRVQMQSRLIEEIRRNPDLGLERLGEIAKEYSDKYGFGSEIQSITKHILGDYARNHDKIMYYREKYPDNKDLYAALFGVLPRGEVGVDIGPMTLHLRCYDAGDYAWAFKQKFLEMQQGQPLPDLSRAEVEDAGESEAASLGLCAMPGLEGIANIENTSRILRNYDLQSGNPDEIAAYEEYSARIRVHEEQHSLRRLFKIFESKEESSEKLVAAIRSAETEDEKFIALRQYFVFQRELEEPRYRDELLAYLKEWNQIPAASYDKEFAEFLSKPREQGGTYDFLGPTHLAIYDIIEALSLDAEALGLDAVKYTALVNQVFIKDYKEILESGIKAFIALRAYGYTPEAAVAHLISEPVVRWPQVVRRAIKHKMGE